MKTEKKIIIAFTALGFTIAACGGGNDLTNKAVQALFDPGYPTEQKAQKAEEKRGYPESQTPAPKNNPTAIPTTVSPLTSAK